MEQFKLSIKFFSCALERSFNVKSEPIKQMVVQFVRIGNRFDNSLDFSNCRRAIDTFNFCLQRFSKLGLSKFIRLVFGLI